MKHIPLETLYQKEFFKNFESLTKSGRHDRWRIWADFISLAACSLCLTDRNERIKEYDFIAKRYRPEELKKFVQMLNSVVDALGKDPDQDFLGKLFMILGLGNNRKGQFFTPYEINKCIASLMIKDEQLKGLRRPWTSIYDPACGAGALLIAFAQECLMQKINYQTSVLFVAQDIDRTAALMCFIQLSLLGCPGYVVISDTITNPIVGYQESPLLPVAQSGQEIWYTPMLYSDIWQHRIAIEKIRLMEQME